MPFGKIVSGLGKAIGGGIGGLGSAASGFFGKTFGGLTSQISNMVGGLDDKITGLTSQLSNLPLGNLAGIGAGLLGAGNPWLSSLFGATSLLGGLQDKEPGFNAIKTGRDAGIAQRMMMDEAYPGTNPWERLGTGQAGAQSTTEGLNRSHQLRLQDQELASRERIAERQAMAAVAPAAIMQHPEMAAAIMGQLGANVPAGPNLSKAMSERRFSFDKRVKDVELALQAKEVDIKSFSAETQRWMAEIAEGRLNVDEAYKEAEILLGDKNAAIAHVQALTQAFQATHGSVWKSMISGLDKINSKEEFEAWLEKFGSTGQQLRDAQTAVPGPGITMKKRR